MVNVRLLVVAVVVATPTFGAKMAISESWGKPGVSYNQYREDSVSCISAGYYKDVSGTTAAKSFVEASRKMDTLAQQGVIVLPDVPPEVSAAAFASDMKQIERGIRPKERMTEVRVLQQSLVDDCLRNRGYIKFRLTTQQTRHLSRMQVGREERRRYLYELAHDPAVLNVQGELPR